jgi:1-acyl-sn-glycerol-3-phosphate acyltransferase
MYMKKHYSLIFPAKSPGRPARRFSTIKNLIGEGLRRVGLFPPLWLLTRPVVYGHEQLTHNGPYIFVANHNSHMDAPLLLFALPPHLRLRLRVAAAADYFFSRRWKGTVVQILLNAFAFERKGLNGIWQAQQLLSEGQSILLFPEGTRSKDGRLQPFKNGIGKLILATQVPIVPVWIEGTHEAMPKGTFLAHPHRVTVRFGTPFQCAPDLEQAEIVATVEQAVRAMAPCTFLDER